MIIYKSLISVFMNNYPKLILDIHITNITIIPHWYIYIYSRAHKSIMKTN